MLLYWVDIDYHTPDETGGKRLYNNDRWTAYILWFENQGSGNYLHYGVCSYILIVLPTLVFVANVKEGYVTVAGKLS